MNIKKSGGFPPEVKESPMKRCLLSLFALTLILPLASCGFGPAESSAPPEPEGPLRLESLSVEVSRSGLSSQELARAVRELPEPLKDALGAQGVEAGTVTISVGSSPEAMAQAVSEGGVDVAFLQREDYDALEQAPSLLLSALPESGEAPDAMAAIVRSDNEALSGESFAAALAAAVNSLREEQPVFGPYDYACVRPDGEAGG